MASQFIQVPPNSTGLKVQTYENTVNGNVVESEAVTLTRGSDNTEVGNSAQPLYVQGSVTAIQGTGSNLHVVVDTAPTTAVTLPAGQAVELLDSGGTNKASISAAGALKVDGSAVTQPVSTKTALVASSPTAATVGVTSAQALATNASRLGLVITNTSANTISLGLGAAAVLNSGITLMPNGGVWVMDEYTFGTFAINAIASAASSNLAIQELT